MTASSVVRWKLEQLGCTPTQCRPDRASASARHEVGPGAELSEVMLRRVNATTMIDTPATMSSTDSISRPTFLTRGLIDAGEFVRLKADQLGH